MPYFRVELETTSMKASIRKHYDEQARRFGRSPQSTMLDLGTRSLEVARLERAIRDLTGKRGSFRVLEVGCGNGYALSRLSKSFGCEFVGVDANRAMIAIASGRRLRNVTFKVDDILNPRLDEGDFDIVFSERCLINLETWSAQKKGLENIRRFLRRNGHYVMLESFVDGLDKLNEARKAVGLGSIPTPWHNRYLRKRELETYIKGRFEHVLQGTSGTGYDNFLSSYFFGSRVLYPALIQGKREVAYNNGFVEFFRDIPPAGNFSPIQLCILQKR
jgi:SAM-dependent methyltransferase